MRIFILEDEIYKVNDILNFPPRRTILEVLLGHDLTVATNSFEARDKYKPPYDLALLDHDMRGYHDDPEFSDTGYQFVKWLALHEFSVLYEKPKVILHSQNDAGRFAMASMLLRNNFIVTEFRYGPAYIKFLRDNYAIDPTRTAQRLLQGRPQSAVSQGHNAHLLQLHAEGDTKTS